MQREETRLNELQCGPRFSTSPQPDFRSPLNYSSTHPPKQQKQNPHRPLPTYRFQKFVCLQIFKTSSQSEHGITKSKHDDMVRPLPLFGSGTPHAPQLDPVAKGRVLVARARPLKISTNKSRSKNCRSRTVPFSFERTKKLKRDCRGVRDLGSAGYRTGCKRLGSVTVLITGVAPSLRKRR